MVEGMSVRAISRIKKEKRVRPGDPAEWGNTYTWIGLDSDTKLVISYLVGAFSKKLTHLKAAVALFMAWYNFARVHQTLRVRPAMEAGLTDHIWSVQELLNGGAL